MDEPALVRRLTTIISVDVVGFSTMSARNEEHALDLLGARMATTETIVKHHRGRVFKLTGDGMLAEFVSPVEAVRAALEVQESMRSANATADQDNQLILRIGINLGDVVESGDDLMGDAVNVAVRLESIAPQGGICVSASIYEQIVGKLTLGAEDMGEQHVKNIPRPIHAYRLTPGGKTPIVTAPVPPPPRKGPSRLVAIAGGLAVVAAVAIAGAWLLHEKSEPAAPAAQVATSAPASPATPPAPVAAPPAATAVPAAPPASDPNEMPAPTLDPAAIGPRIYDAADVPFVPDSRRRALENYAQAEGSKAMAINVRGFFSVATRRVDDPTARRIALEECTKLVRREVPVVRPIDRCMTYAVGNNVVWSYRPPPLPLAALRSGRAAVARHPVRSGHGTSLDGGDRAQESHRSLRDIRPQAGAGAGPRSFRLVVAQRNRSRRHQAQPAGLRSPDREALRRLCRRGSGARANAQAP